MTMQKISIVFEETGERDENGDQPFNVYLAGHDSERLNTMTEGELSAAEFWARESFRRVFALLKSVGAIQEVKEKKE